MEFIGPFKMSGMSFKDRKTITWNGRVGLILRRTWQFHNNAGFGKDATIRRYYPKSVT